MTMLPREGGNSSPYAMSAPSRSIQPWPSCLHLGPWGPVRASCLWNLPRVWRQSTFPSAQSCLPPSPQWLLTEHYPRHHQHARESQNWFPKQHKLQQTITMHVFVRRCHLSIRPANASWASLTMTWRMRCLTWDPKGQDTKPLRKGIQPELGLTLCHLWPISWQNN